MGHVFATVALSALTVAQCGPVGFGDPLFRREGAAEAAVLLVLRDPHGGRGTWGHRI